jgi:hypothetical protein
MGFIGTTTLLNHDVSIDSSSKMTWSQKINARNQKLEEILK